MRKSVGQAPTAGQQTQQKPYRTFSDIGAEQENHSVGRGPTYDRKRVKKGFGNFVRIFGDTQIHFVSNMHNLLVIQHMVNILTSVL
jgi:hypothetical protein